MAVGFPLALASRAGILNAAQPSIEAHSADTLLVARQAKPNVVGSTCTRFRGEVRIGNLAADYTDQIALTFG